MAGSPAYYLSSFSIGALFTSIFPQWALPITALALVPLVICSINGERDYERPVLHLRYWIMALCGVLWVSVYWQSTLEDALDENSDPQVVELEGRISNPSVQRSKSQMSQSHVSFDFLVTSHSPQFADMKLQVRCYRCDLPLHDGEIWRLTLKVKPVLSFRNPGGFDYRRWLLVKGYGAQAYVFKPSSDAHYNVSSPSAWDSRLTSTHLEFKARLQNFVGSEFLNALIFGDKYYLSAEQKRLMTYSGLGHLFVVSGLHIGLVSVLFAFLSGWLLRPLVFLGVANIRPLAWIAGAGFAFMYAWISGFQVPAIRAMAVIAFGIWLLLSNRKAPPIYYWLMALVLVLLLDPLAFMSMGAWLSFSIVGALLWAFWGVRSKRKNLLMSGSFNLLKAQFYAFVSGAIIMVLFSVPVSLTGIVLNLILIPLFSLLILPLAMVGMMVEMVLNGSGFIELAGIIITYLFDGLSWLQPRLKWLLPAHEINQSMVVLFLMFLLLPFGMAWRLGSFAALLLVLQVPTLRPDNGSLKVTILDAGQGSAAVLQTTHHTMLVDTGRSFMSGMTAADFVVLPYLRRIGVDYLDRMLITHDDNDHSGGAEILSKWGPRIGNRTTQAQCDHETWSWDGVTFEQFQVAGFKEGNNGSCLLYVSVGEGQYRLLLAGDIEKEAELALIQQRPEMKVEVLWVPHHGSKTSSSTILLEQLKPRLGLISAGRQNGYGHPHPMVVKRYEEFGVALLGTHSHGAIEVILDPSDSPRQKEIKTSTYAASGETYTF